MKEHQLIQNNIDAFNTDDAEVEDDENDYDIDSDDSDVDTDDIKMSADVIPDDYEVQKNAKITEKAFLTGDIKSAVESTDDTTLSRNTSFELQRQVY